MEADQINLAHEFGIEADGKVGARAARERSLASAAFAVKVDKLLQSCYKIDGMRSQELKAARLGRGWSQTQVAARVGVSQAYLNMLENGKRRLTSRLTRKLATIYGLSPVTLPVSGEFVSASVDDQHLAESLARLGYPGFAYLRTHTLRRNPSEVLLMALTQERLEARVAEALPWVVLEYWQGASTWFVEQARKLNIQNRLGFVVSLARLVSERDPENERRTDALRELESMLEESRLAKEDVFYRPPRTEGEREWFLQNRSEEARHWNLLTDLRPAHLPYGD
jgi:transcriptional regulator with XRE-family HTH domain